MIIRLDSTPVRIMANGEYSSPAKFLYVQLWLRAIQLDSWFCAPSLQDFPPLIGMSERSVYRASMELQSLGLVDVELRWSRRSVQTHYRVKGNLTPKGSGGDE